MSQYAVADLEQSIPPKVSSSLPKGSLIEEILNYEDQGATVSLSPVEPWTSTPFSYFF